PQLAHEEVMELEAETGRDVRIRPLLVRQSDVEPDRASAGLGRAAIRGLHDAAPAAGADHERRGISLQRQRPFGQAARELSGFRVVSAEWPVLAKPRRAEEDDRLLYPL